ncbi:recombinase family protein [Trichocoleus sp. FACHB-832]|uniref:fdxN element excision recombinase XisF n=1 Tax=Trichocoleus sp. FACHB-832 TaxID=2692875 RepID=UPI0016869C49|nr:fdxN element excision recombinase XisF [Trichocoleus sp. FACHB-832]MBD1905563.1 recombinase family protein [Trichocoleus sp. FACHB-832]
MHNYPLLLVIDTRLGEKMNKRIKGYARVSTREQAINSQAFEQQKARLREAGATEIIEDVQTGKKDTRPGLLKIMSLVQKKEVDEVVITRIDRLGRSVPIIRKNIDIFQKSGINLRALDQMIDLSTSQGMFAVNLLASLAELEVDMLSERTRHGKQHRRNQKIACESYPWGYTVVDSKYKLDHRPFLCLLESKPPNYLELYKEEDFKKLPGLTIAEIARDCIELFFNQKGVTRAVRLMFKKYGLGKTSSKKNGNDKIFHWSPSGFQRWLNNPVLQGHTVYSKYISVGKEGKRGPNDPANWVVHHNTHPDERLITDEDVEKIKEIISFNSRLGQKTFNRDPNISDIYREYTYQNKLVFCGECGSKCMPKSAGVSRRGRKIRLYFGCRYSHQGCSNRKSVQRVKIEDAIIKALVERSRNLDQSTTQSAGIPPKSERLIKLEVELESLNSFPGFNPDIERLKQERFQQIQEEKNPFSSNLIMRKTAEEIFRLGNDLTLWYTLSNDAKVEIFPKLVEKVIIRNGEIEAVILVKTGDN